MKSRVITVKGNEIAIIARHEQDYISTTGMVKNFDGGGSLIEQWLKNKYIMLFLGVWEQLNKPLLIPLNSKELKMKQDAIALLLSVSKSVEGTASTRGNRAKVGYD